MNILIEKIFINSELNETENIINNTMKHYIKTYGNSYWDRHENIYNFRFFDKIMNEEKNITNKRGVKITIIASNGRYKNIEMNNFISLIEVDIKKNVIYVTS